MEDRNNPMRIAVIGWGSLLWNQGNLKIKSEWYNDGPELPVEYLRHSSRGRLTLVLCEGWALQTTYWAASRYDDLGLAINNLADREGCSEKYIHYSVKQNSSSRGDSEIVQQVLEWLQTKEELDAVIWTGLPPTFSIGSNEDALLQSVLGYLRSLEGAERDAAEEYIRNTPGQIRTVIRESVERKLGWYPIPVMPKVNID